MLQCIHLLTEAGDKLLTELGDFIVISCTPVPIPVPVVRKGMGGYSPQKKKYYDAEEYMAKLRKIQAEDDVDIVKVLTEFLARQ